MKALGYWQSGAQALNAKVLTRYYALLQISIAEELSSPTSRSNLLSIQRRTEFGGHNFLHRTGILQRLCPTMPTAPAATGPVGAPLFSS